MKLSPLERERWLLAEQNDLERASTEARLDLAQRAQLRADDQALRASLFAKHPPAELAKRVQAHARPRRTALHVTGLAALACAMLLFWRPRGPETERAKGQTMELRVYRQRAGVPERLADHAQVAPGELVQLGFVRAGHGYGVLLSIDGRGGVTLHFPLESKATSALPKGSGEQLLAHAYELDDAPLFERFVFVGADQPLSVDGILQAARRLAADPQRARSEPLEIDRANEQRSLLLHKAQ